MKKKEDPSVKSRREFLKGAGVTGAVAGVASVAMSGKPAKAKLANDAKSAGYSETEHVKTYYELARF
jgi:nitrous oxide reductase